MASAVVLAPAGKQCLEDLLLINARPAFSPGLQLGGQHRRGFSRPGKHRAKPASRLQHSVTAATQSVPATSPPAPSPSKGVVEAATATALFHVCQKTPLALPLPVKGSSTADPFSPAQLSAYTRRMLELEGSLPGPSCGRYTLRPDFLHPSRQRHITPTHRAAAVDWMTARAEKAVLQATTLGCAVSMLDRYLAVTPHLPVEDLMPMAGAALVAADKLLVVYPRDPLSPGDIADVLRPSPSPAAAPASAPASGGAAAGGKQSDNEDDDDDDEEGDAGDDDAVKARFRQLEWRLYEALEWKLEAPTVTDWLQVLVTQVGLLADAAAVVLGEHTPAVTTALLHAARQVGGRGGRPVLVAAPVAPAPSRSASAAPVPAPVPAPTPGIPSTAAGQLAVQVSRETFIALLCCTAGVQGVEDGKVAVVGTPLVTPLAPLLPRPLQFGSWPRTLIAPAVGRDSVSLPSPRCPSKLLVDAMHLANAVALHAGHAAFPPSVLACAILAATVAGYATAAAKAEASADAADGALTGAGGNKGVLRQLAQLQPVVEAVIRAVVPGSSGAPLSLVGMLELGAAPPAAADSCGEDPHAPGSGVDAVRGAGLGHGASSPGSASAGACSTSTPRPSCPSPTDSEASTGTFDPSCASPSPAPSPDNAGGSGGQDEAGHGQHQGMQQGAGSGSSSVGMSSHRQHPSPPSPVRFPPLSPCREAEGKEGEVEEQHWRGDSAGGGPGKEAQVAGQAGPNSMCAPVSLLSSALTFAQSLAAGLPVPVPHRKAAAILTSPAYKEARSINCSPAALPYLAVHNAGLKGHVETVMAR